MKKQVIKAVRYAISQVVRWQVRGEGATWEGTFEGLPVVMRRHVKGEHWLGWVQVPEYHKWHGKSLHICTNWPQCAPEDLGQLALKVMAEQLVWKCDHRLYRQLRETVHGGVTFAGKIEGKDGWWLGFDCGHLGDLSPGILKLPKIRSAKLPPYRSAQFARQELQKLAQAVKRSSANA